MTPAVGERNDWDARGDSGVTGSILPGPRSQLRGKVNLPPSKSLTNRGLIAAAAAGGGTIASPLDCDDTRVLAAALAAAGWPVDWQDDIQIGRRRTPEERIRLDLAESGTGARLILGLLAASPGMSTVDGSRRLRERPMQPLIETLDGLGANLRSTAGALPIEVNGRTLDGGPAVVRPHVSSQFVSSLVLAAPLMRRGLDLEVVGPLPSAPYLDLTEDVMRAFAGRLDVSADRRLWRVAPTPLQPTHYGVEGDWSAAAFVMAAAAVAGGEVDVGPLSESSRQGDRAIIDILEKAGLGVQSVDDRLRIQGPIRFPLSADLSDTPDLFPALAVVAAAAPAGSELTGLEHLKHKESDRLSVMVENLRGLGARLTVERDRVVVEAPMKREHPAPPTLTAAGDHRIAMATAVAALAAGPVELDDPSCVAKSYPGFWEMWGSLTNSGMG